MENPREDVKDVILGSLDRPTLRGQAATLQKYCLPDVEFYYLYFNTKGIREMTAIYQIAQVRHSTNNTALSSTMILNIQCRFNAQPVSAIAVMVLFVVHVQVLANYQGVIFEQISYDETALFHSPSSRSLSLKTSNR
jgi:hypothetical protein